MAQELPFFELVYNFLLVTQTTLPRIVARSANRVTYEYPTDQGPLALLPGALEDACRIFDALDKQLKQIYGKDLFPLHLRGKMPFLRYFGCSQKRVGYYARPLMLRNLETISGIAEGLHKGTINSLHVPNMPPLIQKRHHPNDDLSPDEVYATFRRHQQRAYARVRASLAQGREFRPFFVLGAPVNRLGRFSGHGLKMKTAGQCKVSFLSVTFWEELGRPMR